MKSKVKTSDIDNCISSGKLDNLKVIYKNYTEKLFLILTYLAFKD